MNEENAGKCCLFCSYIYEVNHVETIWRSTEYDATRKLHQWEIVRDCFFTISKDFKNMLGKSSSDERIN